jgi:hypothetical protein
MEADRVLLEPASNDAREYIVEESPRAPMESALLLLITSSASNRGPDPSQVLKKLVSVCFASWRSQRLFHGPVEPLFSDRPAMRCGVLRDHCPAMWLTPKPAKLAPF